MTAIHHRDSFLLKQSLESLSRQSELEYTGEYGAEITTFVPFVAWLKREGYLKGRRIRTYAGMRPYYFFLDDSEFASKSEPRRWLPVRERYWPSNSTYHATASPWHEYPDYRRQYAKTGMRFERPVIFVQNKFAIEWNVGPINYIPIVGLNKLLERTSERFDVVYSRPGSIDTTATAYSADLNFELSYPDAQMLARFRTVYHLEKLCADEGLDYNQTKLEILAKSRMFVAVQGGGAHVMSCFGNSFMLLLDRNEDLAPDGNEYPHAYRHGPYKYLAKVPPHLVVLRSFRDFLVGLRIFGDIEMQNDRIILPLNSKPFLDKWTL